MMMMITHILNCMWGLWAYTLCYIFNYFNMCILFYFIYFNTLIFNDVNKDLSHKDQDEDLTVKQKDNDFHHTVNLTAICRLIVSHQCTAVRLHYKFTKM